MKNQLPDTPWHIGSPKMKESDHRRLNKWCVHYESSFCKEPKSGCYMLRCAGSSHCKFYAENEKASRKIEQDNRTQMEIDAEKRRKYIQSLRPQMQALVSSLDDRRYQSVRSLDTCYICGNALLVLGKYRKQCSLCHMEYVDQVSWLTDNTETGTEFVFVMGRNKPASTSQKTEKCQFRNGNGICKDNSSSLFQKQCDPELCKKLKEMYPNLKQMRKNTFTGVKNIPLSSIIINNQSKPSQYKIDRAAEMIRRDGNVPTPVYVGLYKDKYILKDGYIWYLAAHQCGLDSIPATLEYRRTRKK